MHRALYVLDAIVPPFIWAYVIKIYGKLYELTLRLSVGPSVSIDDSRLILVNVTKEMTTSLQLNISNNYGYSMANVYLIVFGKTVHNIVWILSIFGYL